MGSNIGDRESNIAQAISALEISHGIDNVTNCLLYTSDAADE